jgi:hypothetical protein
MGRLAIPPTLAYGLWPPDEGGRHAGEAPSGLVTTMLIGGREASWSIIIVRGFVLFVPVHGISHSKKSSYQVVLIPW